VATVVHLNVELLRLKLYVRGWQRDPGYSVPGPAGRAAGYPYCRGGGSCALSSQSGLPLVCQQGSATCATQVDVGVGVGHLHLFFGVRPVRPTSAFLPGSIVHSSCYPRSSNSEYWKFEIDFRRVHFPNYIRRVPSNLARSVLGCIDDGCILLSI
jgi:hypothetical protein